jgi:hypothetical protein
MKTMKPRPGCHLLVQALKITSVISLIFLLNSLSHEATGSMQRAQQGRGQLDRLLRRYERIRIDRERVVRQVRETGELMVTTSEQTFNLSLEPYDLRAPNYHAEEELLDGTRRPLAPVSVRTYRGTAPEIWDSEARFTVKDGSVEGVILTPDEWYYFEPLTNFSPASDPAEMVVYRRSDVRAEALGKCGTTLAHRIGEAREWVEPQVLAENSGVSTAEVATEADYEYVQASGGAAEANATILDVLNQVDGIYQTELSVSLQVVYQHAWSSSNDPYTSTAASTMLSEFRNYWNANFYGTPYDLAHMWTGKDMDGGTIGVAYLAVVCDARTYSYGISQRFTYSPGKYILTAHEIGHNFGATHTDQANPPQAQCSNTIMNSSVGTGFTFCSFSRTEIAAQVTGNPSCLSAGLAAPSNLTATAISSSQINLAWQDNTPDETGFVVESKAGLGGTWSQVGTAGPNATTFNITGLASNTTYLFRVQATGAGGPSSYSNEASATTLLSPPTITGILPSGGGTGTVVAITGTGFAGATAVRFNGTNASFFAVISSTQINATVPTGVTTGPISVTTASGTATSSTSFTVTQNTSRCDINSDGSVNVLDIQLLINSILGIPGSPVSGDLNRDGGANVLDLQLLINVILGLRTCPA